MQMEPRVPETFQGRGGRMARKEYRGWGANHVKEALCHVLLLFFLLLLAQLNHQKFGSLFPP